MARKPGDPIPDEHYENDANSSGALEKPKLSPEAQQEFDAKIEEQRRRLSDRNKQRS